MKKILFALFCLVVIFSSCNKNKKFNTTLNGTWLLTTENSQAIDPGESFTLTFAKTDTDAGKVTFTYYTGGSQDGAPEIGTYKITDKGTTLTINVTAAYPSIGQVPGYSVIYKVVGKISDQTKTKFTFTQTTTGTVSSSSGNTAINDASVMAFSKE